jgi:hypothetical protein
MAARGQFSLQVDGVAGSAHPHEYLFAIRAELGVFHASGLEQNQGACRMPLDEKEFVAGKGAGARSLSLFADDEEAALASVDSVRVQCLSPGCFLAPV